MYELLLPVPLTTILGSLLGRVYLEEITNCVNLSTLIQTSSWGWVTLATLQGISRMNATLICCSCSDNEIRVAIAQ